MNTWAEPGKGMYLMGTVTFMPVGKLSGTKERKETIQGTEEIKRKETIQETEEIQEPGKMAETAAMRGREAIRRIPLLYLIQTVRAVRTKLAAFLKIRFIIWILK